MNARKLAIELETRQWPLHRRWGWAGVCLWTRFLLVCERQQGRAWFDSEDDLASQLQVGGLPLVDGAGEPFTLTAFFRWTGERKWTRRHRGRSPAIEYRGWPDIGRVA